MMRKFILSFLASLCCSCLVGQLGWAAMPTVAWSHQVVDVTPETGLCDTETRLELANAVDKQLHAQAKLPFILLEKGESFSKQWDVSQNHVAMVPVLRDDSVRATTMELSLGEKAATFYKYVLHGQLDLIFCSFDAGGDVHFLYDIPIFATRSLGVQVEEGLTTPKSEGELRQEFLAMFTQALREQLATVNSNVAKYISARKMRNGTQQVTEVRITSPVALRSLDEADLENFRSLIAGAYTSAYIAKHPNAIMLPNKVSADDSWKQKVAANIQTLTGLERMDYAPEEEATLPVTLDLFKLSTAKLGLKHNELSYFDYVGTAIGLRAGKKQHIATFSHKFLKNTDLRSQLLDLFPEEMSQTATALGKQ